MFIVSMFLLYGVYAAMIAGMERAFMAVIFAGDKKHGENAYFEDLVERAARGGSNRNPKNIDLVILNHFYHIKKIYYIASI